MSETTIKLPKTARDWQGKQQIRPRPSGKVCDHRNDLNVTLFQQGKNRFAVVYGLQIKQDLNYSDAAHEYGCCIMHALACIEKLEHSSEFKITCEVATL